MFNFLYSFCLKPYSQHYSSLPIEISLMEANPGQFDQKIGDVWFDLGEITKDKLVKKTFLFNEVSELDMEFETKTE